MPLSDTAVKYLWAIESRVFLVRVPLPWHTVLQDRPESRLRLVPDCQISHPLFRVTRRQSDLVLEAERLVYGVEKVESGVHFLLDLVDRAEDVGCT